MVDINNRKDIIALLNNLKSESVPKFGKMTAQHMVEHLTFAIMFSNGKLPQKLYLPLDKAELIKEKFIYSDNELPIGFKAPMLGDDLPKLIFPDLNVAVRELLNEVDHFDNYFLENGEIEPINPTMGKLDKREWIIFHNKHFAHHFRQFNLL